MTPPQSERPTLSTGLSGHEFMRWYWLKDELTQFARVLGIRSTGNKELLTERIAAALDGHAFTEPSPKPHRNQPQLSGPLTAATVIPQGQRCSQAVRTWFIEQVGPSFGFDAAMRSFFARADGTQTLQDALEHYRATRGQGQKPIEKQFEYNRFTRAWHDKHPDGGREDMLAAWHAYRRLPIDERGRELQRTSSRRDSPHRPSITQ